MSAEPINYHESLLLRLERPHITECPNHYHANNELIDRVNFGEYVPQDVAFSAYFEQMKCLDPDYHQQIERIVRSRSGQFPESQAMIADRKLQLIIPAYREGENMDNLLRQLEDQMSVGEPNWGATIVMDHAVPYRNRYEHSAKNEMSERIDIFLEKFPKFKGRLDYVFYTRRKDTREPVLPVGLARKVGEDVLMMERMMHERRSQADSQPLYLGLMDMDTGHLSPGLLSEMAATVPRREDDTPSVLRVKGSFDVSDVRENPHIHPLQMMWEGTTSEVGRNSRHNPFNIGRLSAVPARELAMTGGGFARRLPFTDEDIRHGLQIKWNLPHVQTSEVAGRYSTSARREVHTVNGILQWLTDNGGEFDLATMEIGALIRMYGDWTNNTYRRDLGNVAESGAREGFDPLTTIHDFERAVPPHLLKAMVNAFYRFTATSMYAVDELSAHKGAPEIASLREQFLSGEVPYFHVQLQTLDFLRKLHTQEPERFENLKPVLNTVDDRARQSISNVLKEHGVYFVLEEGTLQGLLEGPEHGALYNGKSQEGRDRIPLVAPFQIPSGQTQYMHHVREQLT